MDSAEPNRNKIEPRIVEQIIFDSIDPGGCFCPYERRPRNHRGQSSRNKEEQEDDCSYDLYGVSCEHRAA